MRLSVIVPVLDEEASIGRVLASLAEGLADGDELIIADGGSRDRTLAIAKDFGATVVASERGRGRQMNAAAAVATGDALVFVHADTTLPDGFRSALEAVLRDADVAWGRFDLAFDEGGPLLRLIAHLISWRSRVFRSATGDQAMFVRRATFESIGGYREARLFEDVDLARRLRRLGRMGIPSGRAVTSSRRWRNRGVWATTARMWTLKTMYLFGVPSERLAEHYDDER